MVTAAGWALHTTNTAFDHKREVNALCYEAKATCLVPNMVIRNFISKRNQPSPGIKCQNIRIMQLQIMVKLKNIVPYQLLVY